MKRENKWEAPDLVAVKQSKTKKVIGSSRMVRENNSFGFGPPLGYTCKNNKRYLNLRNKVFKKNP